LSSAELAKYHLHNKWIAETFLSNVVLARAIADDVSAYHFTSRRK